jgi:hypothetical protein
MHVDDIERSVTRVVANIQPVRVLINDIALPYHGENHGLRSSETEAPGGVDADGVHMLELPVEGVGLEVGRLVTAILVNVHLEFVLQYD